ncbi:hypothetical protein C8J57DRAFT_1714564 [Mycena rebaudengoi]|nr:hypothetical protein C8J57DRAFT_1714564 [Mycena rebaudengoi]
MKAKARIVSPMWLIDVFGINDTRIKIANRSLLKKGAPLASHLPCPRTSRLPRTHVSPDTKPPLKRKPAIEEGGEAVDPEEPAHLHKLQTNSFAPSDTNRRGLTLTRLRAPAPPDRVPRCANDAPALTRISSYHKRTASGSSSSAAEADACALSMLHMRLKALELGRAARTPLRPTTLLPLRHPRLY